MSRHAGAQKARRRALQALYQWQLTGQGAAEIVHQFRQAQDFEGVDSEYFESLVRCVVQQQDELDQRIEQFVDRALEQTDPIERNVLRIAAWEAHNAPHVPYRVILDEAVELAHRFGAEQGHAYVNGVLDKAMRSWRPEEHAQPG